MSIGLNTTRFGLIPDNKLNRDGEVSASKALTSPLPELPQPAVPPVEAGDGIPKTSSADFYAKLLKTGSPQDIIRFFKEDVGARSVGVQSFQSVTQGSNPVTGELLPPREHAGRKISIIV